MAQMTGAPEGKLLAVPLAGITDAKLKTPRAGKVVDEILADLRKKKAALTGTAENMQQERPEEKGT